MTVSSKCRQRFKPSASADLAIQSVSWTLVSTTKPLSRRRKSGFPRTVRSARLKYEAPEQALKACQTEPPWLHPRSLNYEAVEQALKGRLNRPS